VVKNDSPINALLDTCLQRSCVPWSAPATTTDRLVFPPNHPAHVDTETKRRHTMNILLWVLQVLAAVLYAASGVMKVFMFDRASEGVPSFAALPRNVWMALGILELACMVGLIVPAAFRLQPTLTVVAAMVLAIESLVFIGVHIKYREIPSIILSGALGLLMAFIASGRMVVGQ
jgi:hypothetical protein